jgi:hypothetical protein
VFFLVPALVGGRVTQSKRSAEIDDFCAGAEHGGRELHGNSGGGGQEYDRQALGANSVRSARDSAGLRIVERLRAAGGILTMFEKDHFGVGMRAEEADEFGATIAGEAGDADVIFIHRTE